MVGDGLGFRVLGMVGLGSAGYLVFRVQEVGISPNGTRVGATGDFVR